MLWYLLNIEWNPDTNIRDSHNMFLFNIQNEANILRLCEKKSDILDLN